MKAPVFGAALALLAMPAPAASPLWSIYWMTDFIACQSYMGSALQAAGKNAACTVKDPASGQPIMLSICPGVNNEVGPDPYNQGQFIQIGGYQLSIISTDPDATLFAEIGSGFSQPEADIFASCAGKGAAHCDRTLSTPILQGGPSGPGGPPHMDVYAECSAKEGAMMQVIAILEYVPAP